MADRILSAEVVARGPGQRRPTYDALKASHEALRADLAATRGVARLWMGGWRPEGDEWVWAWSRTTRKPITDDQRRALDALEAGDGV